MNITATIQARMNSQRLPGKVLTNILGKPMLQWQIERLQKSRLIDEIIVATTNTKKDKAIQDLCKNLKIKFYRGSEDDVLMRINNVLNKFKVDIHVECFGDSPLVDPQIIDEAIGLFLKKRGDIDFLSSTLKSTYPAGQEISIYESNILSKVNSLIKKNDPLREHAGFNITRFPNKFKMLSFDAPPHLFNPNVYLEVDTEEDLVFIKKIFHYFEENKSNHFGLNEILNMIKKKPELTLINRDVKRKWKDVREKNLKLNS